MSWLLTLALLLPLLGVSLAPLRTRWRPCLPGLMTWAALPALALALFAAPGLTLDLPWLLTGLRLGLDATGRIFLLFTALLWLIAGGYARGYLAADARAPRFAGFFLATLAGNLGLILAQDVVGFYLFYALMTFAAFGLIVHTGTVAARRAGLVYLVMAILGEALLLVGFLLLVNRTGSLMIAPAVAALAAAPGREAVIALLLAGFGIKAGALLLHLWLPLAHPVAPTPASAVLSGAMIKAGLLGWLRFVPLGLSASDTGMLVLCAGLAAAFYAVAVGLVQRDPKVILAYSSISQMGLMTFGVGLGLLVPEIWPLLLPAVTLYAVQHALTKGALFLGVGVVHGAEGTRRGVLIGLGLLALGLAGGPFSAGAAAKQALKVATAAAPWGAVLMPLLPLAAVATTLLMARFLWQVTHPADTPRHDPSRHPRAFWWLATITAVTLTWWLPLTGVVTLDSAMDQNPIATLWPVLVGALLAFVVGRTAIRKRWVPPSIAPGDVLWPLIRLGKNLMDSVAIRHPRESARERVQPPSSPESEPNSRAQAVETRMRDSAMNGALILVCLLLLMVLLV